MANFGFHTTGDEIVSAFADKVKGKTFLITGPSPGGIGAETALCLAKGGAALLILAGRSSSKIQPLIKDIEHRSPGVKTTFIHLQLDSQASVKQAVKDVQKLDVKVDSLINNAAVMACPYSQTVDGIEMQFGTNHIGHFLFTNLLLQSSIIPNGGHIVNVSSSASEFPGIRPHFDDVTYQGGASYQPWAAYSVSKMANVLYTRSLSKQLHSRNITVLSLHPGSIASGLQRHLDEELLEVAMKKKQDEDPSWVRPPRKSLQEGCSTTLRAALDPSLAEISGAYLDDCQIKEPPQHLPLYQDAEKIWRMSEQLLGEQFAF